MFKDTGQRYTTILMFGITLNLIHLFSRD